MVRRLPRLLVLLLLVLLPATPLLAQSASEEYRIGPKDLIEIAVPEVPALNLEVRVSESGTLNLPLLGELPVNGMTEREVEAQITEMVEARYVQPGRSTVTVKVNEYRSRPINIIGAVNDPGPLDYPGRWTLLEALTAAGGLTGNHAGVVYVLRRADNGLSDQIEIPVDELMMRANAKVNIPIYANDLINVPAGEEITVYVLGEVGSAGALSFRSGERITLLSAIAKAGGMNERASKKIKVKRRIDGGEQELTFDYRAILSGKVADPNLENGDVIHVRQTIL